MPPPPPMLAALIALDWSPAVEIVAVLFRSILPPIPALPALAEKDQMFKGLLPPCPAMLWASMPEDFAPAVVTVPLTSTLTASDPRCWSEPPGLPKNPEPPLAESP